MRALITGASGFLGRHLVRRLGDLGWALTLVDIEPLPAHPAVECAIQDDVRHCLPRLDRHYDLAVHLAAMVGGRIGIEHDPLGVAINMSLDVEFFSFACRTRPARCIYPSSSAVYPVERQTHAWDGQALREEEVDIARGPLRLPDLTYGWSKLTGEYLAWLTQERFGVRTAVYRPFSVYGPGQGGEYPVPAICGRALAREDPLIVWGPGTQQRDFVYIEDFLDVVLATYEQLDASVPLNIASGTGADFTAVARTAADLVGYRPIVKALDGRPTGVQTRIGSPERMARWTTTKVTLEDGLASVLRDLRQQDAPAPRAATRPG
jgi:UDP-glucose 4-epimerase